jgi:primosomal protein N' (replication factor Y)
LPHFLTVGVPVPGLGLLTYRLPERLGRASKGARVLVPLGSRVVTGLVVDPDSRAPEGAEIRDVIQLIDERPYLPPLVVDLAVWIGSYYVAGPGDALSIALPPAARGGRRTTFRSVQRVEIVEHAPGAAPRTEKQRMALDLLRRQPGLTLQGLAQHGVGPGTIRSLARTGFVAVKHAVVERDPFAAQDSRPDRTPLPGGIWSVEQSDDPSRELSVEQARAVEHIRQLLDAGAFRTVLLQGVTGSGKTEVFLRAGALALATGKTALVLVPEIGLTPVVAGLFRARFGSRVAIQHSGLSPGERHDQWNRIRRGDVAIVVGTRSAVFAPLENVGVIIADEEHDGAYKQEDSPRYHGRDVAIMRARLHGAVALLGSATPSLESSFNVARGRYEHVTLTRRIHDRPMAQVEIVDMRREYAARGGDVVISSTLTERLAARLGRGEQSVLLLNRRGFATVIFCRQCGASLECPHCSVTLTYHRAARRVRCHYCNYAAAVPTACGACGGAYLEQSGFGTERIEHDVRAEFPDARVARIDRDTIRRRGALTRVLQDVKRGAIDILVGTQMIAKGHDFPAVTLAGVIGADVGLGLADFRAAERTFQLLTQVVGRAGRGETPGEAVIQTLYPDHYAIRAAAAQDYSAFYEREMDFRSRLQYPPHTSLINVVVKGRSLESAMTAAQRLIDVVRATYRSGRVVGPAPAALSKIKDEYRSQFFIKGRDRAAMRKAIVAALESQRELKRRTMVDVDPMSVI